MSFDVILKSHTSPITNVYLSNFRLLNVWQRCCASEIAKKALGKSHPIKQNAIFDTVGKWNNMVVGRFYDVFSSQLKDPSDLGNL